MFSLLTSTSPNELASKCGVIEETVSSRMHSTLTFVVTLIIRISLNLLRISQCTSADCGMEQPFLV